MDKILELFKESQTTTATDGLTLTLAIDLELEESNIIRYFSLNSWTSMHLSQTSRAHDELSFSILKKTHCKFNIQFTDLMPFFNQNGMQYKRLPPISPSPSVYYRPLDRVFFQLIAFADFDSNGGRLGFMKYGDGCLSLKEIIEFARNPNEQKRTFHIPLTLKTFQSRTGPYKVGDIVITLTKDPIRSSLLTAVEQRSAMITVHPQVNETFDNQSTSDEFFSMYITRRYQRLHAVTPVNLDQEVSPYEVEIFFAETLQPMSNYFYTPFDIRPDERKRIKPELFQSLFTEAESIFFAYIDASPKIRRLYNEFINKHQYQYYHGGGGGGGGGSTGTPLSKELSSNPELQKILMAYGCIIFCIGMCTMAHSLPYISDECITLLSREEASVYTKYMASGNWSVAHGILLKHQRSIESFQDPFRTRGGDCEDLDKAILLAHKFFITMFIQSEEHQMNQDGKSGKTLIHWNEELLDEFSFYAHLAMSYVVPGNLSTVSAAKIDIQFKNVYPQWTEDGRIVTPSSSVGGGGEGESHGGGGGTTEQKLGGHVFALLLPFKWLRERSVFHQIQSSKGGDQPSTTGSLSLDLVNPFDGWISTKSPWREQFDGFPLPRMIGEGTGPQFPLLGSWAKSFDGDTTLQKHFNDLQKKVVIKDSITKAIISFITKSPEGVPEPSFSIMFVSHDVDTEPTNRSLGTHFYRYVKQFYTTFNYSATQSGSIHKPSSFCWLTELPSKARIDGEKPGPLKHQPRQQQEQQQHSNNNEQQLSKDNNGNYKDIGGWEDEKDIWTNDTTNNLTVNSTTGAIGNNISKDATAAAAATFGFHYEAEYTNKTSNDASPFLDEKGAFREDIRPRYAMSSIVTQICYGMPSVRFVPFPEPLPIERRFEERKIENLPPQCIPSPISKEELVLQTKHSEMYVEDSSLHEIRIYFPDFHRTLPNIQQRLFKRLSELSALWRMEASTVEQQEQRMSTEPGEHHLKKNPYGIELYSSSIESSHITSINSRAELRVYYKFIGGGGNGGDRKEKK